MMSAKWLQFYYEESFQTNLKNFTARCVVISVIIFHPYPFKIFPMLTLFVLS